VKILGSLLISILLFLPQPVSGGEGAMGKKVVMIIAKNGFRDEELQEPKTVLEKAGVKVVLASSSPGTAVGMLGARVKVEKTINEVNPSDYDAVIFVGGRGASEYFEDSTAHSIAKRANEQGKLVCAICIAPVTLARAGLLTGKRATVFSSEANELKRVGAVYTRGGVEVDSNIITADGPASAKEFGKAILTSLRGGQGPTK